MEQRAKPTEKFNVQKRCEEIHAQHGTSEMANYRIQQMCDKIAQDAFNEGRRSVIDNTSKPRLDKFTLGIIPERFDEKVWIAPHPVVVPHRHIPVLVPAKFVLYVADRYSVHDVDVDSVTFIKTKVGQRMTIEY